MKYFFLALSLFSLTSYARMGGGELGPPAPPSFPPCDEGAVNACRASELSQRDSLHAQAHDCDAQLASLANQVSEAAREKANAASLDDGLAKEATAILNEISFLNRGDAPAAKQIIAGFASAEDLFGLTPDERSWRETYPAVRTDLLNTRLKQVSSDKAASAKRLQENSSNYSSLNDQYQSLKSHQDSLYSEAQVHETRSGTECQQRYCPGR